MYKKTKFSFNILTILGFFLLCSCGYDTQNWPRISFPFHTEDIVSLGVEYKTANVNDIFVLQNSQVIANVYKTITYYPYKETCEKSIKGKEPANDLKLIFHINVSNFVDYQIHFIEYGISDSLVIFNDEIHFLPGCVACIYEETKK